MTVQTFIEKAIEGGWSPQFIREREGSEVLYFYINGDLRAWVYWAVLQPGLWKAVGKVEGWTGTAYWRSEKAEMTPAEFFAHNMVQSLFEGKSIEEYLETL